MASLGLTVIGESLDFRVLDVVGLVCEESVFALQCYMKTFLS